MFATVPRRDRLETLSQISRAVSSTLDLHTLYETIYTEISRVMDATMFSIAVLDPDRDLVALPYIREDGNLLVGEQIPFGGNVTSLVIKRGSSLSFGTHHEYRAFAGNNGLPAINVGENEGEAVLFVPMHTGSRTIGTLSVESNRPDAYAEEDLETLTIIASQAAVAIENARLYARSQNSIRQMRVLLHVAQTINQSLDLQTVLQAILASMREVMPYEVAAILLPDFRNKTLDIVDSVRAHGESVTGKLAEIKVPIGEGVSGKVFSTGLPIIVPDVRQFAGFVDHGIPGVLCEMAVPLQRGDSVVGVLDVGRNGTNAFLPDEVNLLSLFASQAAIAIENARLFEQQRRRVEELQTVQTVVQKLTPLHDRKEIAQVIDLELKRLIDYHACRVYLMDDQESELIPIILGDTETAKVLIHQGFAGWIATEGRADIIFNTLEDSRPAYIPGTPRRDESMVGAPLVYEGRVRGVITLSKLGAGQFDENSQRLLEIVAAQVAIAFDRARLYEELRHDAITDPLVKLWNRRFLIERYREERQRALRNGRPLAALMVDIDKFKLVNDTYGHLAGDIVLQELSALIRSHMRTEDLVARYGGEEFCVLLPDTTSGAALIAAERLRWAVEHYRFPITAGVTHITVSIGAALWVQTDHGEELFSRADVAMYRVKALGGNAVCILEGECMQVQAAGHELSRRVAKALGDDVPTAEA
ncbi:MAG: diguanylate cyclase [Chloroflexota bacterium]